MALRNLLFQTSLLRRKNAVWRTIDVLCPSSVHGFINSNKNTDLRLEKFLSRAKGVYTGPTKHWGWGAVAPLPPPTFFAE